MKKRWQLRRTEGQSLVEMALTLPVLILMFVGLIEVGAALRNYLIVVNANREGVRYAARGRWFDVHQDPGLEDAESIFDRVVAAAGTERRGDEDVWFLRLEAIDELPANTTMAVHYFEVPDQVHEGGMRVEPAVHYGPWYVGSGHVGESRIDAAAVAEAARQENYDFNQKYVVEEHLLDIPSEDNFIIVEVWYDHQQLLGLPIFTEILPETVTLYARTRMRVTLDARVQ
jgi:hypothetical protein